MDRMNEYEFESTGKEAKEAEEKSMAALRNITRYYVQNRTAGGAPQDMTKNTVKLEQHHIKATETVLSKGDRVELIPVKYGVVVKRIRKETVFEPPKQPNTSRL